MSQSTPIPEAAAAKGAVGTAVQGTKFTHPQVLDLFVRYFKRPGPAQGTIIFHPTQAGYDAAEQAAGFLPGTTLGFFDNNLGLVHLPPTVSTLTAMHESLHVIGAQSGVDAILGRYVEEGLTEWLARSLGPEAARRVYDDNVAFVRLLANIVGENTLRDAYLHRLWAPLRSALRARLGGDADVEYFYRLLRRVGPEGQDGRFLRDAMDMLWPGSSGAPALPATNAPAPPATTGSAIVAPMPATPKPPTTTRSTVGAQRINQMIEEEIAGLPQVGNVPLSRDVSLNVIPRVEADPTLVDIAPLGQQDLRGSVTTSGGSPSHVATTARGEITQAPSGGGPSRTATTGSPAGAGSRAGESAEPQTGSPQPPVRRSAVPGEPAARDPVSKTAPKLEKFDFQTLPVPEQYRNLKDRVQRFGTQVIRWGEGSDDAFNLAQTLRTNPDWTRAYLEHLKREGVTREMAQAWSDAYKHDLKRNWKNSTARQRSMLMALIASLL